MKKFLKVVFPYLVTVVLWSLSTPVFNPFGILAIIPIFYYMFCNEKPYWFWFGLLMSFMLDFNFDTLFVFCALFLFMNAINGLYGVFDEKGPVFGIQKFNFFVGTMAAFLLINAVFNEPNFLKFLLGIGMIYALLIILYLPVVVLLDKLDNK